MYCSSAGFFGTVISLGNIAVARKQMPLTEERGSGRSIECGAPALVTIALSLSTVVCSHAIPGTQRPGE